MVTKEDINNIFKAATPQETVYAELNNGRIVKHYGTSGETQVKLLCGTININEIKRVFRSLNPNRDGKH